MSHTRPPGTVPAAFVYGDFMNLHISTAIALQRQIYKFTPADFDIIGITKEQFDQLSQEDLWIREQMPLVMQTFRNLLFATCNAMGYPKFVLPCEYIAPHVATIISPANAYMACAWLAYEHQSGVPAQQLADGKSAPSEYERVPAERLFALVCLLYDHDDNGYARQQYRKRLGVEIAEAMLVQGGKQ